MRFENVLEAVGGTPIIRLNRIATGLKPKIYAKCEFFNPGGSVKDRIGTTMIDDAERRGLLKPGGTIIEGTSGNTGIGLALVAALRGYKLIFTITDKQSREKINLLKALGAEVIVCPTAVEPEDPRSYYSVAKKLSMEIPNAFYPNQYENPQNPAAHYAATGPEIWEDTNGQITHFVAGMGTGGTISGVGKFLKEKNPKVKVIGADPIGSLYYEKIKFGRVGKAHPYVVEGIGEDIFPGTMDLKIVDDVVQTPDKDCFVTTRRLARLEGLLTGGSGGAAVWAGLKYAEKLGPKDYMDFYMGTTVVGHRADLTPVYALIFRRLKGLGLDWRYVHPRLHIVDLSGLREALEHGDAPEWVGYDPSEAFAREHEERKRQQELAELRESLDAAYRESIEEARRNPPPPNVQAYRQVYGRWPDGWPPDEWSRSSPE